MYARRNGFAVVIAFLTLALAAGFTSSAAADAGGYGFGASTQGGNAYSIYTVTSSADTTPTQTLVPGTLRYALSLDSRNIKFSRSMTITLNRNIRVPSYVTVNGSTAGGVTLRNAGLEIRGAHDVIVRGMRFLTPVADGVQIDGGAYNVLVDHVTVIDGKDDSIDITQPGTRNVTVQWSVMDNRAGSGRNMLISYTASNVSLHHNLFNGATQRNPDVSYQKNGDGSSLMDPSPYATADIRNNVVSNWGSGESTHTRYGARVNIVNNAYITTGSDLNDTIVVCLGNRSTTDYSYVGCGANKSTGPAYKNISYAYVTGNSGAVRSGTTALNSRGTPGIGAFSAPSFTVQSASSAASSVRSSAGATPGDANLF